MGQSNRTGDYGMHNIRNHLRRRYRRGKLSCTWSRYYHGGTAISRETWQRGNHGEKGGCQVHHLGFQFFLPPAQNIITMVSIRNCIIFPLSWIYYVWFFNLLHCIFISKQTKIGLAFRKKRLRNDFYFIFHWLSEEVFLTTGKFSNIMRSRELWLNNKLNSTINLWTSHYALMHNA